MNIIKTVSAIIIASSFITGTAVAEGEAKGEKLADKLAGTTIAVSIEVESCNADAAILCPGLPSNSKKSFMCLMAYEDNLSIACKIGIVEAAISLEAGMMAIDYSIQSCEADADKHCLNVQAGEGRIVSCLKKNEAALSKQCVSALKDTGLWSLGTE